MTEQSKFAYMAGLIDGEGSFSITKSFSSPNRDRRRYLTYKLSVSMSNTNEAVMAWVSRVFGGHYLTGSNLNRKPHYKTRFSWTLANFPDIEKFTLGVLPYLIVKRDQALLTLEFCRTVRTAKIGTALAPEVQQKRDEFWREMMRLNGINSPSEPVETSTQGSPNGDEDTVRPSPQCEETGRNDQSAPVMA